MPLQKNQILTLRIERLSSDGSGVAHSPEGEAVFVPGTAPGDEAQVRIVKDCGRYAFGILDELLTPYLPEACGKQNVEDLYMLLTDVPKEESVVICTGRHAGEMLRSGFEKEPEEDGSWVLPGVVSRKKQFIPALMSAYQEL